MSNFLPNRVRDLNGWIPETDIDGLDVDQRLGMVSETENVVYEDGFFRPDRKPRNHPIPFTPTANENILSVSNFYHTDKGRVWVYVIWNSNTSQLYLYVADADGFSDYVYLAKGVEHWANIAEFHYSSKVNYAEFDNVLKINTDGGAVRLKNSLGTIVREWQKGEYSLEYIDVPYRHIPITDEWYRPSGWYFSIRWLGATCYTLPAVTTGQDEYGQSRVQTASDETGLPDFNSDNAFILDNTFAANAYYDTSSGATVGGGDQIDLAVGGFIKTTNNIMNVDYIKLKAYEGSVGDSWLSVQIASNVTGLLLWEVEYLISGTMEIDIPTHLVNGDEDGNPYHIRVDNLATSANSILFTMEVYPISSYVMMTNYLGQHTKLTEYNVKLEDDDDYALDQPVTDPIPIMDSSDFNVRIATLDFDIRDNPSNWTMYIKWDNEVLYIKQKTTKFNYVPSGMTIDTVLQDALRLEMTIDEIDDSVTTLNSTYGLGASVLVFPIIGGIFGHNIVSETYYKNRSYIVNGTKEIYLSHIAGDARLQSDSFPYSKRVEFGYIYGDNSDELLVAIAVTPLDELLVLSSVSGLVYTIQASQSIVYRKIKATNGNVGIGNPKSLLRNNIGKALAEVLLWTDAKGAYLYGGGINQPKNVIQQGKYPLYNYWKDFYSTSMIGAYNPMRNEALFISGDLAVVLDLSTMTWRKIRFTTQVSQFIGIIDYNPYFLMDDDTIIYLDETYNTYVDCALVTHYTSNYAIDDRGRFIPLGEMTDKFMQECYVSMHKNGVPLGSPIGIHYDIIADGNVISPRIYFSGQVQFEKTIAPLLIRYRQVKIRLILSATDFQVKEFGYTHNTDTETIIRGVNPDISGSGFGNNFGNDFGVYL